MPARQLFRGSNQSDHSMSYPGLGKGTDCRVNRGLECLAYPRGPKSRVIGAKELRSLLTPSGRSIACP